MRKTITYLLFAVCSVASVNAQEKWDLRKIVDYALVNNISIKQTELQTSLAELQLKQSKLNLFPTLNMSLGPTFSNGRNQDPTTFSLITQSFLSANMQLQTSAQIFNWFSRKNTILANEWQLQANKASTDKLKNDIALTLANAYLQILLAKEQEKIAVVQLQQTQAQYANTQKLVNAGALPELNAAELESQVARDSSSLVTARGNVEQAILQLKSGMNLDAAAPFEVQVPPVELIPIEKIGDLQPDAVYALAIVNLPQQRVNDFNLKVAQKNAAVAKATMYPTVTAFGSLNSRYAGSKSAVYDRIISGYSPTGLRADAGNNVYYDVQSPIYQIGAKTGTISSPSFGTQINQNFSQAIGLSLNIPIFNGSSARTTYRRSLLSIKGVELQKDADNQKIKQDIYQAYNSATVALEKFNAGKKAVESSQRSYDFAKKRYDVGMLSTLDLITNQNNLFRAKLELVLNQFDYVFKMKVLEFYRGQGLKL